MKSLSKKIVLICLLFAIGGCNFFREKELKELWAQTVQEDSIDGYIAFLAEQKTDEDGEVGNDSLHGTSDDNRSKIAYGRIFELVLKEAHGTCPFKTLRINVRQTVSDVKERISFSDINLILENIGVKIVNEGPADDTLDVVLDGWAIKSRYMPLGPGTIEDKVNGVVVRGDISLSSNPDFKIAFQGKKSPPVLIGGRFYTKGIPGMRRSDFQLALDQAKLSEKFAHLFYNECGPRVGALIYYGSNFAKRPSWRVDPELETRIKEDIDVVAPILIAAALGSGGHILPYERSDKAGRFLMNIALQNKDVIVAALRNSFKYSFEIPKWLPAE